MLKRFPRLFVFGAAVAILAATLALCAASNAVASEPCFEDDPCWNWATMGNHKRGIVTLDGDPMVVGPCKFQRLWQRGAIRYSVTFDGRTYKTLDRMRGDGTARRMNCD